MPQLFQCVLVACLGLVFGSFTSALSFRVARKLPWAGGRSACPSCKAALGILDLVPVLSWLALRGRCRHCGAPIGIRYPLTELTVMLACLGLYAAWGFNAPAFIAMAAVPFLAALLLVDLEQMILPDGLQVVLAALGILFVLTLQPVRWLPVAAGHIGAAMIFAGLVWLVGKAVSVVRRKDALGFGDVKFFAVAGLWLGLYQLPLLLIAGGVCGVVLGIGWRLAGRGTVFPFGPALITAFYLCLLLKGMGFPNGFGVY